MNSGKRTDPSIASTPHDDPCVGTHDSNVIDDLHDDSHDDAHDTGDKH